MRKQIPPELDDKSYLERIIKAKNNPRKSRLLVIKKNIEDSYDNFLANPHAIHSITSLGIATPEKEDLQHCYDSSTAPLLELKDEIKSNLTQLDRHKCPYCNAKDPSEFDHYLPKSKFAEFSIMSKNLIWSCHRCNHKKLEQHNADPLFINTYYTQIPADKFIFCKIDILPNRLEIDFFLKKPPSCEEEDFEIISNHFENLALREMYIDIAAQIIPNWIRRWIKMNKSLSLDEVVVIARATLTADIAVNIEDYGVNYYEVALMEECNEKLIKLLQFGSANY